ncbi:MAG TPA: hypothetical protein PLJ04_02875 [Candidatus Saccharibacteria bacterium]|nr:hypothetical protein [Candidatus Saccharibacteria bacterium]MCB9817738.1 hypothetical protein [Candidatus Nomurabacteria bacterium]HPD98828.1 hypothetical protein [Candidatus Saccharibacteria bacterium]HPR10502.1 hypothetical protein [Candidatus Saccharibacteria bacterium]
MDPRVIRIIRIVLILLVLFLFIWLIIWLFRPSKPSNEPAQPTTPEATAQQEQLQNVRYVQDGEITGPEQHYSIVITVNATSRRIDIYNGYNVGPMRSESYINNQASYDAYYSALKNVGFFSTRDNTDNVDRTSYCPLGIRYSYIAGNDLTDPVLNSWSASCNRRAGTFAGNAGNVKTLFKNQIPDYATLTKGINL